jgi:hypothetical protein
MFHVFYVDRDDENEDGFDQHESRETVKQGIVWYRKFNPSPSDFCE